MLTKRKRRRAHAHRDRREHQDAPLTIHDLHAALARVEALASAARAALEELPFVPDVGARCRAGRLYYLVEETAAVAAATLAEADRRMADRDRSWVSSRTPRGRR